MEKTYMFSREQYLAIKAAWKTRKNHDATDHIIYNAMRSLPLDKGFTPISKTNFDKIRSNEEDRWCGFNTARRYAAGRLKGENDAKLMELWGILPTPELLEILKIDKTPYMYLFIRKDLTIPQQIVQTAHAVDELNKVWKSGKDTNHMVLLEAKHEDDLLSISRKLKELGIEHHIFYEPDISAHTAIATRPLIGDERVPLRKYRLM